MLLLVRAGPQLDVPHSVTPQQLETLLNGLLQNEDKLPYSFYLEENELAGELGEHLAKAKLSVEKALVVTYLPQAVFRVRRGFCGVAVHATALRVAAACVSASLPTRLRCRHRRALAPTQQIAVAFTTGLRNTATAIFCSQLCPPVRCTSPMHARLIPICPSY